MVKTCWRTPDNRQSRDSGLFARHPLGFEFGIGQPLYGVDHRLDSLFHMSKVDVVQVVVGTMVLFVQPEAGDSMSNDAALGQRVVIGASEELLCRMRIGHKFGAVFSQFRT